METPLPEVRAKLALSMPEVLLLVPWGRVTLYSHVKEGHLETFTLKGRRYATTTNVQIYVERIAELNMEDGFEPIRNVPTK